MAREPQRSPIVGFHQDEEGDWVAQLACGHTQHVRHNPPWQQRPWVTTEAGRHAKLGVLLDCTLCAMPVLPEGLACYRRTATFTESNVPKGLLNAHSTQPGVWGRIVVEAGRLQYELLDDEPGCFVLRPGVIGVIPPAFRHQVKPLGPVQFHVEFWTRDRSHDKS